MPAQGPVFAGCSVAGSTLTIALNTSMGEKVTWSDGATTVAETTALYVLAGAQLPANAADNHHAPDWQSYGGPYESGHEACTLFRPRPPATTTTHQLTLAPMYPGVDRNPAQLGVSGWVAVSARVAGDGVSLSVDLGPLKGAAPTAVRYAWGTGGWGAPFLTRSEYWR